MVLLPHRGGQAVRHPVPGARPTARRPPSCTAGEPLPGEQVLLDGNELAGDSDFFSIGTASISPDGTLLAYSTDFTGDERFTLKVKDLATGEMLADEIPGIFYGGAWSADGTTFFYTTSTTPGGPTGSAGTRSAPRPRTTCSSTRRPTSGSGSASGSAAASATSCSRRRQQDHQ